MLFDCICTRFQFFFSSFHFLFGFKNGIISKIEEWNSLYVMLYQFTCNEWLVYVCVCVCVCKKTVYLTKQKLFFSSSSACFELSEFFFPIRYIPFLVGSRRKKAIHIFPFVQIELDSLSFFCFFCSRLSLLLFRPFLSRTHNELVDGEKQ